VSPLKLATTRRARLGKKESARRDGQLAREEQPPYHVLEIRKNSDEQQRKQTGKQSRSSLCCKRAAKNQTRTQERIPHGSNILAECEFCCLLFLFGFSLMAPWYGAMAWAGRCTMGVNEDYIHRLETGADDSLLAPLFS
jgi:hypothetical protein